MVPLEEADPFRPLIVGGLPGGLDLGPTGALMAVTKEVEHLPEHFDRHHWIASRLANVADALAHISVGVRGAVGTGSEMPIVHGRDQVEALGDGAEGSSLAPVAVRRIDGR